MLCAVKSCRTTSSNGDIFCFPEDDSLRHKWLEASRLSSNEISPNQGLCHIHFKADQVLKDHSTGLSSLSPEAVPSLYLETDFLSSAGNKRLSFFETKKNEVDFENNIQDQITSLLDSNIRYQQKICPLLKKLADLEKEKLRGYTDVSEQKTVIHQLFKLNQLSHFKLKKVNKTVDLDENGFLRHKNDTTALLKIPITSAKTEDLSNRINKLLDDIEAMKFVSNVLTSASQNCTGAAMS